MKLEKLKRFDVNKLESILKEIEDHVSDIEDMAEEIRPILEKVYCIKNIIKEMK